jgi:hypothetical protein
VGDGERHELRESIFNWSSIRLRNLSLFRPCLIQDLPVSLL